MFAKDTDYSDWRFCVQNWPHQNNRYVMAAKSIVTRQVQQVVLQMLQFPHIDFVQFERKA
jgi:hypothetical protein